ncbi:MAG: glycosyltransferase family 2 protein [Patescibacteria group bacterium]
MADILVYILYTALFCGLYFQIFLLLTFFEGKDPQVAENDKGHIKGDDAFPSVTVVVPCFNEAKTLRGTIMSLLALDYPKNKLSVMIVDDGSKDETLSIAKSLAKQFPQQVKTIAKENGGKHTAVNLAIAECTTELIGCLDADSFVEPSTLRKMIPYFNDQKTMAVTPAMRVHKPENLLQLMQKAEYNLGIFTKRIFGMLDAIHVTPGPFSIFRRSVFDKIGVFKKAHNTEDMEIAFRIQSHGYRIANCHTAHVYTVTPDTVKKLHRQRTRWIYGFINNTIDYKHILFNKKYGNMGMLTIPCSVISIVFTFYMIGYFLFRVGANTADNIERWMTVGINFHMPTFDLFFFNTEILTFLGIVIFALTAFIVLLGKKLAEDSAVPSRDIVYFFIFYPFVAPFWLGKAVYNTVFAKNTPWR